MHTKHPHLGRCCCCLLCLVLLSITTVAAAAILLIIFVLKPKKPIFQLHSIQLDSLNLDAVVAAAAANKEVNASSFSMAASLLFVTQNPNKLGIGYGSTVLEVLYDTEPVAVIKVPAFYQPPDSWNVTVLMHVIFLPLDLSRFIQDGVFSPQNGGQVFEIQVAGGITAQLHVMNFALPKIKVSLDCRIDLDYHGVTLSKEISSIKAHKALVLSNFPHVTQRCSLALCL